MRYDYIEVETLNVLKMVIDELTAKGWQLDGPTIPYMCNQYGKIRYLQRIKFDIPPNKKQPNGEHISCYTLQ